MATSALDVQKRHRHLADLPARYRARVLAAFPGRVERIVLFGSRARGEAHDESDWDFAVFLDREPTPRDEERLSEVTRAFGLQVQSLMFAGERWLAEAFVRMVKRGKFGATARGLATTLNEAYELRAQADYGSEDLTRAGRQLRERVAPFLVFCRSTVDQATEK
jgi:predicted nucleotidyltransferase